MIYLCGLLGYFKLNFLLHFLINFKTIFDFQSDFNVYMSSRLKFFQIRNMTPKAGATYKICQNAHPF